MQWIFKATLCKNCPYLRNVSVSMSKTGQPSFRVENGPELHRKNSNFNLCWTVYCEMYINPIKILENSNLNLNFKFEFTLRRVRIETSKVCLPKMRFG